MREQYEIIEIQASELSLTTLSHKRNGFRLAQICATRIENGYELFYSFAKDYRFVNYKLTIDEDTEIVSLCDLYPTATLYENEMKELFGVKIKFIGLDYNNKFYRIEQETPFK